MPIQPHNPETVLLYQRIKKNSGGYTPDPLLLSEAMAEINNPEISVDEATQFYYALITTVIGIYFQREQLLTYPPSVDEMMKTAMRQDIEQNNQPLSLSAERNDFYDYLSHLLLGTAHELD